MPGTLVGRIVNRSELATILGVSLPTVSAWIREGMPIESPGRKGVPWQIDTAAVIGWVRQRDVAKVVGDTADVSTAEAEARELRARAALREIELAEKRMEVVSVEDSVRIVTDLAVTIRQQMRGIGARVAPMLVGEEDALKIESTIESEVDGALAVLATYDPTDSDGDDETEG